MDPCPALSLVVSCFGMMGLLVAVLQLTQVEALEQTNSLVADKRI